MHTDNSVTALLERDTEIVSACTGGLGLHTHEPTHVPTLSPLLRLDAYRVERLKFKYTLQQEANMIKRILCTLQSGTMRVA